jgi:toxin-antitoxin system PIN domain toxin
MVILDSNILLYGTMPIFPQHEAVKTWLERALSVGEDIVGITWQVVASFIRISTNRRIFDQPLELRDVQDVLNDLFDNPMVLTVGPTDAHWQIYSKILADLNLSGDIVMDARIVAIAAEHRSAIVSTDKDLRRFSDYVKIIDPLKA